MWAHLLAIGCGLWLMASPDVLALARPAAVSAWVAGTLAVTTSTVALWEATRPMRWMTVLIAAWLVAAPLCIEHEWVSGVNSVLCGTVIGLLSCRRGPLTHSFGSGWAGLWGSVGRT
ncbi:MAG: hypothetical protein AB7K52_09510 [Phycisphaerales bacterium]